MKTQTRALLLAVLALIVWVAAVRSTAGLALTVAGLARGDSSRESNRPPHIDSLVSAALRPLPESAVREFRFKGLSPFGRGKARSVRSGGTVAVLARPELSLNGILFRSNKPQAVLHGVDGRSFICAVGDTVMGQVVVRIENNRIVLRDRSGTWDIAVKE